MAEEKRFENKVKKYLASKGAYYVKYFGCMYTQSGVPDLLVCYKGKFLGLEIKSTIGKPTKLQLHNIDKIREAGGYAIVLSPHNYEEFKSELEKM